MRGTVVICALLVASPAIAHADDKAKAKKLYEEGLAHYNLSEYAEAIVPWKEAYRLTKRALLLFNIGQAYRLSGDCVQATSFYESYAREQPNLKNQAELDDAVALCKAKLAEPAPAPIEPPPAPVPIIPPAVASPPPSSGTKTAGLIVGLAGVALGGGAIYFALDAGKQADALDHYRGEWTDMQRSIEARGRRDQKLGWGLGIAGVSAIGVGVALFVLGSGSSESHGVAVVPTRGGADVSWTRSF
jgi:tetratricopeptide (TPR) repeat protein